MDEHIFKEYIDTATLDLIPQSIVVYNVHCQVLWANRHLLDSANLCLTKIAGKHCSEVFSSSGTYELCPVVQTVKTGKAAKIHITSGKQYCWPTESGSTLSKSVPIFDENHTIIAVLATISGISEFKQRNQEQLRQYDHILKTLPDLVWLKDPDGIYLNCNRRFELLVGAETSDIIGKTDIDFFDQGMARFFKENDHNAIEARAPVTNEEWLTFASDGHKELIETTKTPLYDDEGALIGVVGIGHDITDRKRREQALASSEKRFRSICETAPVMITSFDKNGQCILWNDQCRKILGWTLDEIQREQDPLTLFYPDPAIREAVRQCIEHSAPNEFLEWHPQTKDGRVLTILWANVHLPNGQLFSIGHDITAQRETEEALRVNEEKYRALFENAPQAYQSLDISGHFVDINPGWCHITGYDRDEVIGQYFADLLHPDDREHFEKNFPTFKKRGYVKDVQFKIRHKSGRYIDVEFNGCIGYLPDGSFRQTYCVFQDITQRKKAEEALLNEQVRLANIIKGTNVGTWEWDIQTGECSINDRWAEIIGHTREELVPVTIDTWRNICHPEDLIVADLAIKQHLAGELDHYECELRLRHKSGSWVWVLSSGQVVSRTQTNEPLIMIGTHLDITDRNQMQERLRHTEKMDAIGQLAGGIAHDFNNQLSGILGYADLLAETLTNPQLIQFAENIMKASRRAAELTSQLLAFGRKGKNINVAVKIHEVIADTVSMLERSIDKRISIQSNFSAQKSSIKGDPTQIYNALLNLGINARDAMPDGGSLIYSTEEVTLSKTLIDRQKYGVPPGNYICICVQDSGEGMSKEVQDRIFEPFFTTKEEGKGTGLGLSSVYGTIRNHNGAINVYSEPDQGSAFRIYLPLFTECGTPAEKKKPFDVRKENGHILLVDDELILRKLGSDMLSRLGYQVVTCRDGQDAVDYYRENWQKTDLVILDMIMPRLDGHQAFLAMRDINPNILAILSSGYSINGKAQAILDEGVKRFIGKPFSLENLAEAISQVLKEGR